MTASAVFFDPPPAPHLALLTPPEQTSHAVADRPELTSEPTSRESRDRRSAELKRALATCTDPHEDRRLRDLLVTVHMPIAAALATRYRHRGEPPEDLEQVAYLALTKAARRFDPGQQASFAGFCVPTILGEIKRHFRDRGWVVRPPRRVQELQALVFRTSAELSVDLGREPTQLELAQRVDCAEADVSEALAVRNCYTPTPLDRPVGASPDSGTLGDFLPGTDTWTDASEARTMLGPAMRSLGERDRRILRLRFFEGWTQVEIAHDIGVTQMQVSRVLSRIFRDLREAIGQP